MKLHTLGNGFAKVLTKDTDVLFFRGKRVPDEIKQNLEDVDAPTEIDAFTCEMAGL